MPDEATSDPPSEEDGAWSNEANRDGTSKYS